MTKNASNVKNSLLDKILSTSNSIYASLMKDAELFNREVEFIPTDIPMLNVALSSNIDGGLSSGILTIAGESKRFKSLFGLYLMSAFQKKYPEGVCILYDTEGGIPKGYIEKTGLDWSKIVHVPISCVEELKHEVSNQLQMLKEIKDKNKIFILIDSIGNLASRKEISDALEGSEKADMTRAKQLKSFFRIITMDVKLLDIPLVCVNHTYKSQGFISQDVVGGGTGGILTSDNIWIIKRKQEKENDEIKGYEFTINVFKSRYVKEKSKIPINVFWEDGIHKYSGLSDIALDLKIVEKVKLEGKGKLRGLVFEESSCPMKNEDTNSTFWEIVLKKSNLKKLIHEKYKI